ncbi:sugar phosphate nucleotidyltransferase [Helicobacter sp. 23-1045]
MRAIILCAGLGTRLAPITLTKPKPLLEIRGKSILQNTIEHLHSANIDDIIVVCGYKAELFEPLREKLKFQQVIFPHFATKNSVASLKFVSDCITKGTLILNGDLFITQDFTQNLHFGCSQFLGQEIKQGSFWGYITDENAKLMDIDTNATSGFGASNFGDGIAFFDNEADLGVIKDSLNKCDDKQYWESCILGILDKINFYAFKSQTPFYTEIDSIQDALNANLLTPEEIAQQCATDGKAERLKGITNINYKINFNGKEQVLRIPSPNTDKCIDRSAEKRILEIIAPLNLTPKNDFYASDIKMSDFLSEFRSAEFSDINDAFLRAVVAQMKKLHAIKYDSRLNIPRVTMLGEIQKYENLCKIPLTTPKEHKILLNIARELDKSEFVLCHRDLQLPNIMIRDNSSLAQSSREFEKNDSADVSLSDFVGFGVRMRENRTLSPLSANARTIPQKHQRDTAIKFVDFEYAGFSPIAWELGNFSAELLLSKSQIKTLSTIYGDISEVEIVKGQLLSNYIWALWSWIYHRIDLGRDYLARFDKNLKDLA